MKDKDIECEDARNESTSALSAIQALLLPDDDLTGVPKADMYALLTVILQGLEK